jgi:tripartite-type tricarboxylate transporter receptor subunit TctC
MKSKEGPAQDRLEGGKMRPLIRSVIFAAALAATATAAQAASYPERQVKMLIPLAPGSAIDIVARLIAEKMSASLGQNFYVEDQPGAAGIIGMRAVARSAPDGYTILVANDSVLTMVPHVKLDTGYDPQKDFAPVARLVSIPLGLIASKDFPANNVSQMIKLAKENPGSINYASGGIGSPHHIATELLMQEAGIKLTHVPYKGITAAVQEIIAGHVPLGFTAMSAVVPQLKSGAIKLLAVSTAKRIEQTPDTPTISESGVPGYKFVAWCAMFVPTGTPQEIVDKLNRAALDAINKPDVKKRLIDLGFEIETSTPTELRTYLRDEYKRTGDLIEAAGIKPQ